MFLRVKMREKFKSNRIWKLIFKKIEIMDDKKID